MVSGCGYRIVLYKAWWRGRAQLRRGAYYPIDQRSKNSGSPRADSFLRRLLRQITLSMRRGREIELATAITYSSFLASLICLCSLLAPPHFHFSLSLFLFHFLFSHHHPFLLLGRGTHLRRIRAPVSYLSLVFFPLFEHRPGSRLSLHWRSRGELST